MYQLPDPRDEQAWRCILSVLKMEPPPGARERVLARLLAEAERRMTEERLKYVAGEDRNDDLDERLAHVLYLAATKVVQELWPGISLYQFSLRRAALWDALSKAVEARVKEQGWVVTPSPEEPVAYG